jgi:hypothetical protein
MAFVLRAVEETGAALNYALVVMGDRLGYYRALVELASAHRRNWPSAAIPARPTSGNG